MTKGLIQLCYRKIIDADSQKIWDKYVFDDTYMEFFMQAQTYNQEGKYRTFQEISENVPAAKNLTYLVSTAAFNYIRQLKDVVPDIVNVYGKLCLPFNRFKFEIIDSDVKDKAGHKVAIYFYSDPLTWIDTLDGKLLIAYGDKREAINRGEEVETEMIALQPFLNISSVIFPAAKPVLIPNGEFLTSTAESEINS
ncbi:hypothetical protein ACFP1I_24130 [Dyadobacter subterraneus]|uniref:Uncharacterized protein n=1 Tax=Dyadobacter subterraneus TaxID=2773304 RepID=A0ABR9WLS5_9BACT|nr:hypothetical protein [Dyadobacter subterraneus]MBE9466463.1 hypothetical protein [Dyadobacter subterraneus]